MIDFKTPVLAKLKELAENDIDPKFSAVPIKDRASTRMKYDLYRKIVLDGKVEKVFVQGILATSGASEAIWIRAAHVLGLDDEIVSAAVDATVPPSLKTQVIERLAELSGKKGDDAHPIYAVVNTLIICGELIQFRLVTWKSAWDLLLAMSPGNGFDVDCRKPDSDPQWGQAAMMLGMSGAADPE